MSENSEVRINIEFCETCGHLKQFVELAERIKKTVPEAIISGMPGKQASFEVQVNDELVYSKLQTYAFPNFDEVTSMVKNVSEGNPPVKIQKHQPTECVIA